MKLSDLEAYESHQRANDEVLEFLLTTAISEVESDMLKKKIINESSTVDTIQIDESFITDMFGRIKTKFAALWRRLKTNTKIHISQLRRDIMKTINPDQPEAVTDQQILEFILNSPDVHSAILKLIVAMKLGGVSGLGRVIVELILLNPIVKNAVVEFLKNMFADVINSETIKQFSNQHQLPAPTPEIGTDLENE